MPSHRTVVVKAGEDLGSDGAFSHTTIPFSPAQAQPRLSLTSRTATATPAPENNYAKEPTLIDERGLMSPFLSATQTDSYRVKATVHAYLRSTQLQLWEAEPSYRNLLSLALS